ncbi:MAG: zinc ribbon domain-containing protein [Desulfobacterales bacterium]|nr:zinc ribbon domain-containing protein [Desulfobacterales bacterium]
MKKRRLGRGVAIVGAGMTKFGMFKDRDSKDLVRRGLRRDDRLRWTRVLDPADIDALYLGNFSNDYFTRQSHWGPIIAEIIGHSPKPATRTEGACASSALAFREGVFAIASGYLRPGARGRGRGHVQAHYRGGGRGAGPGRRCRTRGAWDSPSPGVFGAVATAYFAKYGANREHLMNVTIKSHLNAPLNPKAQFPLTIRDMMQAKMESLQKARANPCPPGRTRRTFSRDPAANPAVAWPIHLFDCCPISDGASCILLAAEEIATQFHRRPHSRGGNRPGQRPRLSCQRGHDLFRGHALRRPGSLRHVGAFARRHPVRRSARLLLDRRAAAHRGPRLLQAGRRVQGRGRRGDPSGRPQAHQHIGRPEVQGASGRGDGHLPDLRGLDPAAGQGRQASGPHQGPAHRRRPQPGRHRRDLHVHHPGKEIGAMAARPFSDIAYNQFLNEEKLMGCRCRKCGERYVPPRPLCVKCFCTGFGMGGNEGRGRLVAFTCISIAPPFMMAQGYDRKHPVHLRSRGAGRGRPGGRPHRGGGPMQARIDPHRHAHESRLHPAQGGSRCRKPTWPLEPA